MAMGCVLRSKMSWVRRCSEAGRHDRKSDNIRLISICLALLTTPPKLENALGLLANKSQGRIASPDSVKASDNGAKMERSSVLLIISSCKRRKALVPSPYSKG